MAGSKIGITHEEMTRVATALKNDASQLQTLIKDIETKVNSVPGMWDGAAQGAFLQEFASLKPALDKTPTVVNAIGQQVSDVATAYQNMDNEISSKLKK